jgi:hypothetical protein
LTSSDGVALITGCVHKCSGLGGTSSSSTKCSVQRSAPDSRLERRTLDDLQPGNKQQVGDYVFRKTEIDGVGDALFDRGEGDIVSEVQGPEGPACWKIPTVRFYPYQRRKALEREISHLGGCTVIAIVCPTAVWIAHFWESVLVSMLRCPTFLRSLGSYCQS